MNNSSQILETQARDVIFALSGMYRYRDVYLLTGLLVTLLGMAGNAIIFLSVLKKEKLHTPMFAVIGCLSVADFLAIIVRLIYCCLLWYDVEGIVFDVAIIISAFTLDSSCAHNVLLAIVRFILLVYPFRYQGKFEPKKIIHYSCVAWLVAFVINIGYGIFTFQISHGSIPGNFLQYVEPSVMALKFSVMFFTITILHFIFVWNMWRKDTHNFARMTTQLSFVVTLVLLVQVLCMAPFVTSWIILSLYHHDILQMKIEDYITMNIVSSFALLLNHAVNPIIYVMFLRQVRHICCGICKKVFYKNFRRGERSRTTEFSDIPETTRMQPTKHTSMY